MTTTAIDDIESVNLHKFLNDTGAEITQVSYRRLVGTDNYENEALEVTAKLQGSEHLNTFISILQEYVNARLHSRTKYSQMRREYRDMENAVATMEVYMKKVKEKYDAMKIFLATQGLKDMESMPDFTLPSLPACIDADDIGF